MEKKFIIIFILLFIISIALIIIDSESELNDRIYNLTSHILTPGRKITNQWARYRKLKERNRALLKQIAKLSYKERRYEAIKKENEHLRKILEFQENFSYDLIPCEIINRLSEALNISYLLSKGASSGIREDDPVIGFHGVFGKVLKVGKKTSVVQTLENYNISLSAMDKRSQVKGILKWARGFYLEGVPLYADVREGDTIVTSGRGSVFPRDLKIGKVVSLKKDKSDYSLRIEVEPFENFRDPEVVFLLKK
ncbi:rod shape-determining protein MreC [candidate division WOR-3 bacterium]|nr:rod shape-determining protein MreC [candidate division WOR-3 bacterium]